MKLLIIGGVAGGASAAARAARLDSSAEIIIFERGQYVSFANCGLPYHIGEIIEQRESLMVMTPDHFKNRFGADVRTMQEVISVIPNKKEVTVRDINSGKEYTETYDKLLIATGSSPVVPPIKGIDDPDVMSLWTIPDMDQIKGRVDAGIKNAVVVGGGFIGLEMAENLKLRGVDVALVEQLPQVLPTLDTEMSALLEDELTANGIKLYLNNAVTEFSRSRDTKDQHEQKELKVTLADGTVLDTELVVMGVGIRPNNELAKNAGLEVGERGGIKVNEQLQTSNPDVYAVGDVIEVNDLVLNQSTMIPLAGPANRQGRIAADNIFGANETYKGSLGTAICKVFELAAAATGTSEKQLKKHNRDYLKTYLVPSSHASYYPGAYPLYMKVLFEKSGKILGAQVVGRDGVDKRIDLLATAIRTGLTVDDLAELELSYAPPYGSAKDPVNYVGFVAGNIIKGDTVPIAPDELPEDAFLLDVRQPEEVMCGAMPGATNIPLEQLRERFNELPKDKLIVTACRVGSRAYQAERYLREHGYNVKNMSGGYLFWELFNREPQPFLQNVSEAASTNTKLNCANDACDTAPSVELNACGLQCPGPIVQVKNNLDSMCEGEVLKVTANDAGFYNDLPTWCASTGNTLLSIERKDGKIYGVVRKGSGETSKAAIAAPQASKRTTIVLFSGDFDKAMAAFIIATGFASLGHEVSIFCTFWGLNVLRRDNSPRVKKDILSRMFGMMMPRGAKKLALSKMNMMGAGTAMMKYVMNSKNVDDLPTLISQARLMGVKLLACEMAMNVMGLQQEELIDGVEPAGVANFAALAEKSGPVMFI